MADAAAGSGTAGAAQEPIDVSEVVQGIFVTSAECGTFVVAAPEVSAHIGAGVA